MKIIFWLPLLLPSSYRINHGNRVWMGIIIVYFLWSKDIFVNRLILLTASWGQSLTDWREGVTLENSPQNHKVHSSYFLDQYVLTSKGFLDQAFDGSPIQEMHYNPLRKHQIHSSYLLGNIFYIFPRPDCVNLLLLLSYWLRSLLSFSFF